MARYVMANRRSGKFKESEKTTARASVGMTLSSISTGISIQSDDNPDDPLARRVVKFDADPKDIQQMLETLSSDVIIEPEILHYPNVLSPFGFPLKSGSSSSTLNAGTGQTLKLKVTGNGNALKGAKVTLLLNGFGGMDNDITEESNHHGNVTFQFSSFWTPSAAIASPADAFWATVLLSPVTGGVIDCQLLPTNGPTEWWHNQVGITNYAKTRGSGIKVGVIDSGVGPNPSLDHVTDIGSFVGFHDPNGGADVGSHGSHVTGTIGAKPTQPGDYAGVAPGANLFSARVFPNDVQGAANDDIVRAIDSLSKDHSVDLINMSLGAKTGSQIIRDAIIDALERGTVCICAAGNSNGPVEFPAAFTESMAISALGLLGWGPPGSLASFRVPQVPDKFGNNNLFLANFSCFGQNIDCAGPGVGIIATVPDRHGNTNSYGSMGGTSMASPVVCGASAAILSKNADYKSMPRDETRAQMAKELIKQSCTSVGLKTEYEGAGVPKVP